MADSEHESVDSIDLIDTCEQCQDLGDTTHVYGWIFYTLSPDPLRKGYGELDHDKQRIRLYNSFLKALADCKIKVYYRSIHYELNHAGNIHAHGFLLVDAKYVKYDLPLAIINRAVHKRLGRPGNRNMVCMNTWWLEDEEYYFRYVNKQNVYSPEHQTLQHLEETLTAVDGGTPASMTQNNQVSEELNEIKE